MPKIGCHRSDGRGGDGVDADVDVPISIAELTGGRIRGGGGIQKYAGYHDAGIAATGEEKKYKQRCTEDRGGNRLCA